MDAIEPREIRQRHESMRRYAPSSGPSRFTSDDTHGTEPDTERAALQRQVRKWVDASARREAWLREQYRANLGTLPYVEVADPLELERLRPAEYAAVAIELVVAFYERGRGRRIIPAEPAMTREQFQSSASAREAFAMDAARWARREWVPLVPVVIAEGFFVEVRRMWDQRDGTEAAKLQSAFVNAAEFVSALGTLIFQTRQSRANRHQPDAWKGHGPAFGSAFAAGHRLSQQLTPDIRGRVRRIYRPGDPTVRGSIGRPASTFIEAVRDELWVWFRNIFYAGRSHPLEPDRDAIATQAMAMKPVGWGEVCARLEREAEQTLREKFDRDRWAAVEVMASEWCGWDEPAVRRDVEILNAAKIDLDVLQVQLDREARAAIDGAESGGPDASILARLAADIAALRSGQNQPRVNLSDMERNALIALLALDCVDATRRQTLDIISKKAGYGFPASGPFKQTVSGLGRRELTMSRGGRNGGVWLSAQGMSVAKALGDNGTD